MNPPSRVKIGTQVFEIVLRTSNNYGMLNDSTMGYTLDTENLIVIDSSLKPTRQKTVVLHEVFHALSMVFDTSVKPKKSDDFTVWEHYFIGIYEEALLLLLRDNPDLVKYLLEENI
jgi:hypothetical protein